MDHGKYEEFLRSSDSKMYQEMQDEFQSFKKTIERAVQESGGRVAKE